MLPLFQIIFKISSNSLRTLFNFVIYCSPACRMTHNVIANQLVTEQVFILLQFTQFFRARTYAPSYAVINIACACNGLSFLPTACLTLSQCKKHKTTLLLKIYYFTILCMNRSVFTIYLVCFAYDFALNLPDSSLNSEFALALRVQLTFIYVYFVVKKHRFVYFCNKLYTLRFSFCNVIVNDDYL